MGFGPAPVVLGIILGPIAEDNFLQGKIIAEAGDGLLNYFFTGPINITLILVTIGSVVYSAYANHRANKKGGTA